MESIARELAFEYKAERDRNETEPRAKSKNQLTKLPSTNVNKTYFHLQISGCGTVLKNVATSTSKTKTRRPEVVSSRDTSN